MTRWSGGRPRISANPFLRISPSTAGHDLDKKRRVMADLGGLRLAADEVALNQMEAAIESESGDISTD
jgi:hypothetical protein